MRGRGLSYNRSTCGHSVSEEMTRTAARRALDLPKDDNTSFTVSITAAWLSIATTGPPTSTPTPNPTSVKVVKGG